MAIKKRNIADKDTPRKSNHGGITKKLVSNDRSASEEEHQNESLAKPDALDRALAQASENRRRVKETQVGDRKAQPKVGAGRYIAITTDCQLERSIDSKFGTNDRITVFFEVFLDKDFQESILLTERYWSSGSEESKYCQVLSKLLQYDARLGFPMKDVIGVTCEVIVEHNQTPKGTFSNVADLEVISIEEDESMGEMRND